MLLKLYDFFSDFLHKSICCWYTFELPQLAEVKAYVVGIHLNCLSNESRQHMLL